MKATLKVFLSALLVFGFLGLGGVSMVSSSTGSCPWTIEKVASLSNVPITQLTLALGQQIVVNYKVVVNVSTSTGCVPDPNGSWVEVFDDSQISAGNPTGKLGEVHYGTDILPKIFTYSEVIGPYDVCGDDSVINTASLCSGLTTTNTIIVHVPCEFGCTLTPGYWKTHSEYGPAPYDNTWAQLPQGADTPFFLSGQSWYQVFWTPPAGGNAYYILAHAYMAAKLNLLNGASSTPQVNTAITWAETFFNSYAPTAALSKSLRNQAVNNASIIDNYNNGITGPGHCSE